MIYKLIVLSGLLLFCASCTAKKTSEITEYPRMPDAYRKSDYKSISKRNPYGMSIYDEAEILAEEEYFGSEVVPLEESRRILNERKKQKEEQQIKEEK
jgi:hypothetical protein